MLLLRVMLLQLRHTSEETMRQQIDSSCFTPGREGKGPQGGVGGSSGLSSLRIVLVSAETLVVTRTQHQPAAGAFPGEAANRGKKATI